MRVEFRVGAQAREGGLQHQRCAEYRGTRDGDDLSVHRPARTDMLCATTRACPLDPIEVSLCGDSTEMRW
jgi:hypothetical protein